MTSIGYLHLQGVFSGRNIGEVGIVPGFNLHPVFVEPFQHVGIADLLEFAVIQCGKGNVEGILVVPDGHFRFHGHHLADGTVRCRLDQLVMDGERFEYQRDGAFGRGVQRVEAGEPVGAAEDQGSVRQHAGGPLGVLVPAGSVGFPEMDESAGGAVVTGQTVHGGNPDVALTVFLDGADIRAGETFDGLFPAALLVAENEAVGDGSQPEVSLAVFDKTVGDHHGPADGGAFVRFRYGNLLDFHRVGVHLCGRLVIAAGFQSARFFQEQFRNIGPGVLLGNVDMGDLSCFSVKARQAGSVGAYPNVLLVVFRDGHGVEDEEGMEGAELLPVPSAFCNLPFVQEKEPEVSVGVAEYSGGTDVSYADVVEQMLYRDFPGGLSL